MEQILFFDTDDLLKNYWSAHPLTGFEPIFIEKTLNACTAAELAPYRDARIISSFTHSDTLGAGQLDFFPNLKLIATRSTGYNHINLDYCQRRGIVVCNVPAYGATTVAEFAFALLLAVARKLIPANNDMVRDHISISNYMGFDLAGKVLGVIGTGSIGRHMIQIAQGFGMKILAYDPFPNEALQGMYVDNLSDLYQQSDIISLHVPSTPQNHHLLNEKAFQQMKKGVIIINTARGDLIDTQALYWALRTGIVGGAGLDVLENEDFLLHDEVVLNSQDRDSEFLLDSAMNLKLLQFRNVIATPHVAFNSIDAINRINETTLKTIQAFAEGQIINSVSNR